MGNNSTTKKMRQRVGSNNKKARMKRHAEAKRIARRQAAAKAR